MINNLQIVNTNKSFKIIIDGEDVTEHVASANIRFNKDCFPMLELEMPFARCEISCDITGGM